jgi:hypothetical protein
LVPAMAFVSIRHPLFADTVDPRRLQLKLIYRYAAMDHTPKIGDNVRIGDPY